MVGRAQFLHAPLTVLTVPGLTRPAPGYVRLRHSRPRPGQRVRVAQSRPLARILARRAETRASGDLPSTRG